MNGMLERALDEGTPLIDGERVTFVWRGQEPPTLIGDFNDWGWGKSDLELAESEPGFWTRSMRFPIDTYMEYGFRLDGERVLDPLNRRTVSDGVENVNNFFEMPEAAESNLVRRRRGVPHGEVTRHDVDSAGMVVGRKRTVRLYQPPVDEPCPLLLVFDGSDYMRRGRITTIVDNLIAEGRMDPVALALVDNGRQARLVEYACSDTTVGFVMTRVLPLAREHLNLVDTADMPGAYGVLGASMGGLMALYLALRVPESFGYVFSQSGAFEADMLFYRSVIHDLIRLGEPPPLRIWMDVGRYEWLLEPNRRLHHLLREKGYNVTYQEFNGGHNYRSWRNSIWKGMEKLWDREDATSGST